MGLQWQWNANPDSDWAQSGIDESGNVSDDGSYIKLNAVGRASNRPIGDYRNILLQKWPAPEFCAETKMNLSGLKDGDTAGYISLGMKYIAISVTKNNEKYEMKFVRGLQDFDCDVAYTDEKVEKITA